MVSPSRPNALISCGPATYFHPTQHAKMVATDAHANDNNNGPHRLVQSRRSAPSNISGVANCNVNDCNDLDVAVPPPAKMPIDAAPNVNAMAVTGAPNNRPMVVRCPIVCETVAVPIKTLKFPHISPGATKLLPSPPKDGNKLSGGVADIRLDDPVGVDGVDGGMARDLLDRNEGKNG